MAAVGMGLAVSFDTLLQRFPALRDLPLLRSRRVDGDASPSALAAIIESEIIPRLLVAHLPVDGQPTASKDALIRRTPMDPADIARFAERSVELEAAELLAEVETLLAGGMSVESALLDLLAPAARSLGSFWESDRCSFVDVTMGLWRLQEIAHEMGSRLLPVAPLSGGARRVLLGLMPGEQHRFGLQLVGDFFIRAGWETVVRHEGDLEELCLDVEATAFDLVGLTVNQDRQVEQLPGLIDSLRNRSANPALLVMIGGAVISDRPELAFIVGADATAPDAETAVQRAEALLNAHGLTGARAC